MSLLVFLFIGILIVASFICYCIGIQKIEKNWLSNWNNTQAKTAEIQPNTQSFTIKDKHFNPNCFTPPLSKIAAISTVLAEENNENINYYVLKQRLHQSKAEFAVASKNYHNHIVLIEQILELQLNSY